MVTKEELKTVVIMQRLTDDMLDKIYPIMDVFQFEDQEVIFKEGDPADKFYLLKRGTVLLEKKISAKLSVFADSIKSGYSFGWSSMIGNSFYTLDAICAESCVMFSAKTEKLKKLLDSDPAMGYRVMQGLLRIAQKRLDTRTEQFLKVMASHSDIASLTEN